MAKLKKSSDENEWSKKFLGSRSVDVWGAVAPAKKRMTVAEYEAIYKRLVTKATGDERDRIRAIIQRELFTVEQKPLLRRLLKII